MSTPKPVWQRPEIAEAFVEDRRALIPLIDGQDELVRRLITRGERSVDRFLDLGAGGGAFAELVMETHPESTGVLVDFSGPMAAAAERRLARHAGRWEYVLADLSGPGWVESPPGGQYDLVVSAFCVHHLTDERKRALYREAYELTKPGGMFLNWDHVSAAGLGDGMLEEWMMDNLIAAERGRRRPRHDHEVVRDYLAAADEDILADPFAQCEWLRDAGFEDVEVYFQAPEIAIFGGVRRND